MRRVGQLGVLAVLACAIAPASAFALDTRELQIAEPAERTCAERRLDAGSPGTAAERWRAPTAGYLTVALAGDPLTPDWDLATFAGGSATAASTNSGSLERANLWVKRGDRVAIQACRLAGGDDSVPLTIDLYATPLPKPGGPRISLESVALEHPGDLARLEQIGVDVTHDVSPTAATTVLYSSRERARVIAAGFELETQIRDLAAEDRADLRRAAARDTRSALPSMRDSYRQYVDYTTELKGLAAQYPGHVRTITIGTSLEGRPIEGVEIAGDVNRTDDGRPVMLNLGLHHAREWPSGEYTMEFALDLARGYGTDPRITALLDNVRVITVPVVNVDGFVASRSFGSTQLDDDPNATIALSFTGTNAYRRKNCRGISAADQAIPCAMRTTGVDLNRNYGAYWGGPGSSSDPAGPSAQIYRGTQPYSEPESKAVLELSESVHPTVVISNHTFTEDGKWLRQPGFNADFLPQDFPTSESYREECEDDPTGALSEDEAGMKSLGDRMAAATGWTSELGYETLCDITGATEDWNYFAQGSYGYTPEARGPNFHADYATQVVAEYLGAGTGGVREAFLRAGEEAAVTANHGVISGAGPAGATLRIEKTFGLPTCEDEACVKGNGKPVEYEIETELTIPAGGQYNWHVNPSSRPDIEAGAGRTPAIEAWTMTCKQPDQERSVAQQVLVGRGQQVSVDWTELCVRGGGGDGSDPGGGDLKTCGGKEITVIGTGDDDKIIGTPKTDVIAAGAGNDVVKAGKGKDVVCGESGDDSLKGESGADSLLGQKGADALGGADGKDDLRGASGDDRLAGGKGRDKCVGGSGRDAFRSC